MTSDTSDIAWLAGFFDGEGTAAVRQHRGSGTIRPIISVVNTDSANLKDAKRIIASIIGHERRYTWSTTAGGFPIARIDLHSAADIRAFAIALLPYLRAKKEQVELVLEFIGLMPGQGKKDGRTPRMLEIVARSAALKRVRLNRGLEKEEAKLLAPRRAGEEMVRTEPQGSEVPEGGPAS